MENCHSRNLHALFGKDEAGPLGTAPTEAPKTLAVAGTRDAPLDLTRMQVRLAGPHRCPYQPLLRLHDIVRKARHALGSSK